MEIIPAKIKGSWKYFIPYEGVECYSLLFEIRNIKFYIRHFGDNSYGIIIIDNRGLLYLENIFPYKGLLGDTRIIDKDKLLINSILLLDKNIDMIKQYLSNVEDYRFVGIEHDIIYTNYTTHANRNSSITILTQPKS